MTSDLRGEADARLEAALARARAADPRPVLRDALRELRERSPDAFDRARRYYEETVVPRVAAGEVDPLTGWIEYGRFVAELDGPGRAVRVEPDGRATPRATPYEAGTVVLFLPDEQRRRAVPLAAPLDPTAPQRATLDLLL